MTSPSSAPTPADQKGRIKSVGKTFEILHALATYETPCRLSELSRRLGMPANMLRAYLVNLRDLGMVHQSPSTGLYELGPGLVLLGMAALRHFDLMKVARPLMEELCERLNEPVTLSIWGDRGPVAVHSVERHRSFPYEVKIGAMVSVTTTAAGRCFLAHLPVERWEALVAKERKELGALAPGAAELQRELETIRRSGIATRSDLLTTREDLKPLQVKVLAAPIFGADQKMVATLAIISQDAAFDLNSNGPQAGALLDVTRRISAQLGYHTITE